MFNLKKKRYNDFNNIISIILKKKKKKSIHLNNL